MITIGRFQGASMTPIHDYRSERTSALAFLECTDHSEKSPHYNSCRTAAAGNFTVILNKTESKYQGNSVALR